MSKAEIEGYEFHTICETWEEMDLLHQLHLEVRHLPPECLHWLIRLCYRGKNDRAFMNKDSSMGGRHAEPLAMKWDLHIAETGCHRGDLVEFHKVLMRFLGSLQE
jgi:hypothetical protein